MGINLHDMGHSLQNQQSGGGFVKSAYASASVSNQQQRTTPPTKTNTLAGDVTAAQQVVPPLSSLEEHKSNVATTDGISLSPVRNFSGVLEEEGHVVEHGAGGPPQQQHMHEEQQQQPQEEYVETQLASALNIAITTTVHDNFINQLQEKLNDFGITVRDVGFEEVGFDSIIQGQLDAYAQKQIAIRTEALTAQMELELAKQRAENDAIIARCNAKADATVKGIQIEAKRHHTLIQAQTSQEAKNMETAAEGKDGAIKSTQSYTYTLFFHRVTRTWTRTWTLAYATYVICYVLYVAKRILDVGEANAKVGDLIGNSQGGQELAVLQSQADIARELGKGTVYTQMGLPVLGFRAQLPQTPQSSLADSTKPPPPGTK